MPNTAEKVVAHFEVKRELFGGGTILARDLRLKDLNEVDLRALECGAWQVLPERDVTGRIVVFNSPAHRDFSIPDINTVSESSVFHVFSCCFCF